jgi:hypothetical protein
MRIRSVQAWVGIAWAAWIALAPWAEVAGAAPVPDTSAVAADTSGVAMARAIPPDSASVSRLALALADSPAARIGVGPRSYVVLHPRVETAGIAFDRVEGFPPRRPAVIAMGKWDTIPPPPNPIPWSQVVSVDRRVMTRRPTTTFGAILGGLFFAGTAYGFGELSEGEGGSPVEAPVVIGIGLAGAVVGGLIGYLFETPQWVEEYPRRR